MNLVLQKANKLSDVISYVLRSEAEAILKFANDPIGCQEAISQIASSNAPLIVSGVGKSGHVANKISSTFCSLGKPAIFVHAAEASHGDLGLVSEGSIVIILSNSGETTELSDLIAFCKLNKNPIISITARAESTLARSSNIVIEIGSIREACRNGLAPTTSTTLMLAIGDALAVGVSELNKKTPEDFKRFHPGGNLAAQLSTARDIMSTRSELPVIDKDASIDQVIFTMTKGYMGCAILMEGNNVFGLISDGDLRRNAKALWETEPKDIASRDPISVSPNISISHLSSLMHEKGISQALVVEKGVLVGLVHILMISGLGGA